MSEKALQSAVIELARLLGYSVYHTHDSRRSTPGFPDLCIAGHNRVIFAELKTARGIVSIEQTFWLGLLRQRNETYTWRPSAWTSGEIERVLRERS